MSLSLPHRNKIINNTLFRNKKYYKKTVGKLYIKLTEDLRFEGNYYCLSKRKYAI